MRFAAEHPDDWEDRLDQMADAADTERKRRKEHGLCQICGTELRGGFLPEGGLICAEGCTIVKGEN